MARKLKVYQTSIGFFELAVAAPSMKAAAEAWGSDPDIFQRGFAKQTDDPKVVEATMAAPGVVLRRPVGSHGEFSEHAALPKAPEGNRKPSRHHPERAGPATKKAGTKVAEKARQTAALELEKQRKREALERKEREAERERARKRRERMIAKANAAFERSRARHDDAMALLTRRREELDKDEAREKERWKTEERRHEAALKELES
jgi:colicin import membrane protein